MSDNNEILPEQPIKKKRGRKPKNKPPEEENKEPRVPKKRGRKPKGGKIIVNQPLKTDNNFVKTNVILHLKCNLKDINSNVNLLSESEKCINSLDIYDNGKMNEINFQALSTESIANTRDIRQVEATSNDKSKTEPETIDNEPNTQNTTYKNIWKKLKELQNELNTNNISDKKSACFWCTYDFDNPSIYIPKFKIRNSYHVYGCFCSPECASSYLMNENIDTSIKFERYQLLNYIYSKVYNYEKNIKPAPDPYYTLDKFYGNLSIEEYRQLLEDNHLLMIIDKPLTRILPELHEENNDFSVSNNIEKNQNSYKIKKKTNKIISKNNILNEHFSKN
tara:strand:- start:2416 stop:3420 length:1005 start_codon:yes stop_codon:yes gene_type:complete